MITMTSFLQRLKEPSTYAGIASCLAGLGFLGLTNDEWDQILGALVALIGVGAIFLKERPDHGRDNQAKGGRCLTCGRASPRAKTCN